MSLISIYRIVKMGWQGFWRNRLLSLAAVLVMSITLLIITVFVSLNTVIESSVESLHKKIDLVIFFKETAKEEEILQLKRVLANQPETKSISYVSKQEAEARYRQKYQNDPIRISSLEITGNVLPRSLEIKADPPEALEKLVKIAESEQFRPLILDEGGISYFENKALIEKLLSLTSFIKTFGFLFSIFFIVIAMLVVFNTIKLTIFTRRDEIEIMRLVGATESFVKLPFAIEGILYGIFGTLIATFAFLLLLKFLLNFSNKLGPIIFSFLLPTVNYFHNNLWQLVGLELLISVIIGSLCAFLAIGTKRK